MKDYAYYCQRQRYPLKCPSQFGGASLTLVILIGLILGTIVYLAQANSLVLLGFDLRTYKKEIDVQQQALEKLQVQATQMQFLPALESSLLEKKMVVVDKVSYISLSQNNALAAAER